MNFNSINRELPFPFLIFICSIDKDIFEMDKWLW